MCHWQCHSMVALVRYGFGKSMLVKSTLRANVSGVTSSAFFSTLQSKHRRELSVLFYGSDDFSLASLTLLRSKLNKCVKSENKTVLNNLEVVTTSGTNPVTCYCRKSDIICHQFKDYRVPENHFDLGIVSSFGRLIPKSTIDACRYGMLNIHGSLLPRWRGASPIQHAILNGDKTTGLTIMKVNPGRFDVGEIVKQKEIDIIYRLTAMELKKLMAPIGAQLLWNCIENLEESLANARPQSEEGVTHARKLCDSDGLIDFETMDAIEIDRRFRAFTGFLDICTTWIDGSLLRLGDIVDPHLVDRLDLSGLTGTEEYHLPGLMWYHRKRHLLCIASSQNSWSAFRSLTLKGRRKMSALGFYNTFMRPMRKEYRLEHLDQEVRFMVGKVRRSSAEV